MKNLDPGRQRWMRARMGLLLIALLFGASRLVHAAWHLQIRREVPAPDGGVIDLGHESDQHYNDAIHRRPRRGSIFDRHHRPLAMSVPTRSAFINPERMRVSAARAGRRRLDTELLARRIATALSMDLSAVRERISRRSRFVWLRRDLGAAEHAALSAVVRETSEATGERADSYLAIVEESRRWYPQRETAAHVTGFVNADGNGVEGVERSYDEHLRGRAVDGAAVVDARRRVIFAEGMRPGDGQSGDDVVLTIDSTIQMIAARELAQTCQMAEAVGGSVIVTEPRTGEVLAMASYPTFNPNDLSSSDPNSRRNRAIADRFEPGSTMKVFSVGGALDAGVIQPGQLINCYGGTYSIGRLTIHDAHPETWLTPMQILARSSNIGAAQIGAALGSDGLERAYRRFGFGDRTGIQLPAESPARFGQRRWWEVEVATVAFGQGIGVTAVQLAQGLNAVANGGRLVSPTLVSRVTDATGAIVEERLPDAGRVAMQPATARLLREMLSAVTEEGGTGTSAAIAGLRVAGKTGTAQKAALHGRGYDNERWVSSFFGFAPANQPRLVITVIIDEPRMNHAGGEIAAPLFRRVMEQSLRYLGALPAVPRPAPPAAATRAPSAARSSAPTAPPPAGAGGVPELRGMTLREAMRALNPHGLTTEVEGSGVVVQQEPPAGAPIAGATSVRLRLEPAGRWTPAAEPR